jgi:hypothetical protein
MTPESGNSPLLDKHIAKTRIRDECDMAPQSGNSPLLDKHIAKIRIRDECDMTPQSGNSPLLKHVSVTTERHAIIDELLGVVISIRFAPRCKRGTRN